MPGARHRLPLGAAWVAGTLAVDARVRATDGVDVAVHDLGGAGPPMVLAHATSLHGLVWGPVASHMTDAFHCIAFDHRGHGDSGVPADRDFGWRGLALDALAVVDGLGLERPAGVGHSAGATALLLAEQARPGTFRALYCYEPIVVAADPPLGRDPDNWLAVGARRRREEFGSRPQALANYCGRLPFSRWAGDALAAYVEHGFADQPDGSVRLKCRRDDEAAVYEMASDHDGWARLGEVSCPVTLACGADTEAVKPAELATIAARLPDATIRVVAGVGHFGPLEDPAAVAASIRESFPPA
jgi:pimeloyl-ACP methyl ester carboxylesterase